VLLLGEEPLTLPLEKLFTRSALCGVTCHSLHRLTKYTVFGNVLSPT